MLGSVKRFLTDETGPTAVEYAVMLMLILSVCFLGVQYVGSQVGDTMDESATRIDSALD